MKKRVFMILCAVSLLINGVILTVNAMTTTVRVGYCSYMAPYQYADTSGQPQGFHIDVLEAVAEKAGLLTEFVSFNTTSEALNALQSGDIDIVIGVPQNQFANHNIRYTDVIAQANICLLSSHETANQYRNSPTKNYPTVLEYRSLEYQYLTALSVNTFLQTGNQKSCVETLLSGDAALLVAVKECAIYYLEQQRQADNYEIINNFVASADYTMAVRNGDIYLCEAINNALAELRATGVYESLHREWFKLDSEIAYRKLVKAVAVGLGIAAIFVASYLVLSMRTKRQLARLVEARTAELLAANYKLEQRIKQARAESELRHSIIEASPAGMVLFDETLHVEYMNRNAMDMAGI
ncbi:MAG: transporter substrate-binding domain-containing protein [Clostridia bacterium]|nr:transporter substrate-binding domain-containing protein [Clostridia bacterium]